MARLATSGFEFQVVGGAAVAESPDFRVTSGGGSPTVETTTVRSGAAALKFASTANIAVARWDQTVSNGTSTFLRAYLRFDGTPTGTARLLTIQTSAGTNIAQAQMASGQTALALRTGTGAGTQQGSSSASLSANTWYRVELKLNVNGASSVAELRLDGALVATATLDLGTTAQNRFLVGQSVATATGVNFFFDDVAINNDSGADQNTYPGPGKIVLLKPVSDFSRAASWLNGASGTTNLWDAVDNIPPVGVAAASATATSQIRSAGTTVDEYNATTATYSSAGIAAADRLNLAIAVVNYGGAASGQQVTGTLNANPTGSAGVGSATTAGAAGTYPSGWLTYVGTPFYAPTPTLGTGIQLGIAKTITTGELFVDLMGVYVEYVPPQTVTIGQATATNTAQPITVQKSRTGGQPSETDLSQPVGKAKLKAVGQTSATNTAQPVTAQKSRTLGQASDTEAAQSLGVTQKHVTLGEATEADLAQAVVFTQGAQLGLATEAEIGQPLTVSKSVAVGQASETDTAQGITQFGTKLVAVGQAQETDDAHPVTAAFPGPTTAFVGGRLTDRRKGPPKFIAVGLVEEFDKARAVEVAFGPRPLPPDPPFPEPPAPEPVPPRPRPTPPIAPPVLVAQAVPVAQATESAFAFPMSMRLVKHTVETRTVEIPQDDEETLLLLLT